MYLIDIVGDNESTKNIEVVELSSPQFQSSRSETENECHNENPLESMMRNLDEDISMSLNLDINLMSYIPEYDGFDYSQSKECPTVDPGVGESSELTTLEQMDQLPFPCDHPTILEELFQMISNEDEHGQSTGNTQESNSNSDLIAVQTHKDTSEGNHLADVSFPAKVKQFKLDSQRTPTTICQICGNEAGRHIHYGGRSCASCRAFFRRSVQSEKYKGFACKLLGRCTINSKSWKSCRWCRFQKCLTSGMKKKFVLNESEREARHAKRTNGKPKTARSVATTKTLKPVTTSATNDFRMASNAEALMWTFSKDEHQQLLKMVANLRRNITVYVPKFFSGNPDLFKELLKAMYQRSKIRYETFRQLEVRWSKLLGDVCIKNTALCSLKPNDYGLLVKHNLPVMQVVIQSILLGNPYEFRTSSLAKFLLRLITIQNIESEDVDIDIEDELAVLSDVMSQMNVGESLPERPLSYEQVFHSPWAASIDIEDRHEHLTFKISPWATDHLEDEPVVDKIQIFLLSNVILLSTDTAKVSESYRVSKLQDHYLAMLHRYLRFKHKGDANTKLADGIMISSLAREAHEIRKKRLPV